MYVGRSEFPLSASAFEQSPQPPVSVQGLKGKAHKYTPVSNTCDTEPTPESTTIFASVGLQLQGPFGLTDFEITLVCESLTLSDSRRDEGSLGIVRMSLLQSKQQMAGKNV
jgi:hypothetical protein